MRRTVSRQFRTATQEALPWLDENPAYWELTRAMLFGQFDTQTPGRLPVLSQYALAKAEGKLHQLKRRNYRGLTLLEQFKSHMPEGWFTWEEHSYYKKKARVINIRLPKQITDLLQEEYRRIADLPDRVYFATGLPYTPARQSQLRKQEHDEVMKLLDEAAPAARPLMEYLNNVPIRQFTAVIDANYEAALAKANSIADPVKREVQVDILHQLKEDAKPLYQPSQYGHTVRLFPYNRSIPMLKRTVRETLCQGWSKYDLRCAQLAICAANWKVPEVTRFLQSGQSIWQELFHHLGLDYGLKQTDPDLFEDYKKVIKDCVYALVYGMAGKNIVERMNREFKVAGYQAAFDMGKHFMKHPLMVAMFKRRNSRMDEIHRAGYAVTCFDKEIRVVGNRKSSNLPSILAEQAQAVEMQLLLPILNLALSTRDFYITCWLHDGFYISHVSETRQERWSNRIQQVVDAQAEELCISTYLE